MRTTRVITLQSSAAKTVTFNTQNSPIQVSGFHEADFYLDITAKAGTTPTLDITINKRNSVDGKWYPLIVFAQQSAEASICKQCSSNLGYEISFTATIAGTTPSFTFSLVAVLKD